MSRYTRLQWTRLQQDRHDDLRRRERRAKKLRKKQQQKQQQKLEAKLYIKELINNQKQADKAGRSDREGGVGAGSEKRRGDSRGSLHEGLRSKHGQEHHKSHHITIPYSPHLGLYHTKEQVKALSSTYVYISPQSLSLSLCVCVCGCVYPALLLC